MGDRESRVTQARAFVLKAEATDADDPETDNAALRYSLLGPEGAGMFAIDELSGEIRVAQDGLDREVTGSYNLTLQVADMAGEGLSTTAVATIHVEDVNDNPPEFVSDEFRLEAPENRQGLEVGRLTVQDRDQPGSPNWLSKFTILEGDPGAAFSIHPDPLTNEGVISLAKALDYEEQSRYELLVSVQNQSPLHPSAPKATHALARVQLQVTDANEAPFFLDSPCRGRANEGAAAGTEIALLRARDPDTQQAQRLSRPATRRVKRAWVIPPISLPENHRRLPYLLVQIKSDKQQPGVVVYSIKGPGVDEDPKDIFSIDNRSGKVYLNTVLDREKHDRFRLKAFALDLGGVPLEDPTDLEILVLDQNDNRPLFQRDVFTGQVVEGAEPGAFVLKAEATDADDPETDNAALRYSLLGPEGAGMFAIDELSGEIRVAQDGLDREASEAASWLQVDPESGRVEAHQKVPPRSTFLGGWYVTQVLAVDNGSPPLTATGTLSVEVLEVNDHAPSLFPTTGSLCREGGGLVLSATDQDLAPHAGPFHFDLGLSSAHNWTLSHPNDTHVLLRPPPGVAEGLHVLPLLVRDSGVPPRAREQLLNVSVCACSQWGTCGAEAAATLGARAGLSWGALLAILCSALLLLLLVLLVAGLGHSHRQALQKGLLGSWQDDLRDNIVNYDEQGGGEEDQDAYDLSQLRDPDLFGPPAPRGKPLRRRDAPHGYALPLPLPRCPSDIEDFINEGLEAADSDPSVPPYDTALIYDYEGACSASGSLSSLQSSLGDEDQDYDYLQEWGPRFQRLAELYGQ
ncbi:PREDICTED: cadherin-15 [Thamnophis sirtalis]|uniref:Cadherin-15 n=1 Tax=Thamnophis sirtalis TaxID=35019 RepID=A0A6I9Y5G0_9SAUR|nr:PREDICTED: cadherin-15 [Thamnophis sirtalis]